MAEINWGLLDPDTPRKNALAFQEAQQARQDREYRNAMRQTQMAQADMQMKNALRQQQEQDALREAWRASGGDPEKAATGLMSAGFGKDAFDVREKMTKARNEKIKAAKDAVDLMKSSATSIMAAPTLDNAVSSLQQYSQLTGIDVAPELQKLQTIGDNPEAIRQWAAGHALNADKLLPQFSTTDLGGMVKRQGYDPLTGKPISDATSMQKTMTPGESERLKIEQARLNLARQTESRLQRGVGAPTGSNGKPLTAAQEVKLRQDMGKDRKMMESIKSDAKTINSEIARLMTHKGLGGITGAYGMIPSLPFSQAGGAENILNNIQGKVKMLGRNIASQSGKLGNMAVQEWKFVADSVAALDPRSPDFKNQLGMISSAIEGLSSRTESEFNDTYAPYLETRPELAGKQSELKPATTPTAPPSGGGWGKATVVK